MAMAKRRAGGGSTDRGHHIANPWWECDKGKAHGDLFALVKLLRRQSTERRRQDQHHQLLYGNLDVAGRGLERGRALAGDRAGRSRYNLTASAVDTAQSLVTTQKPKPMYLTSEGDFAQQRQARLRSRALEGQLDDSGMYEIGPEVFLDGGIEGTGAVFGYIDRDLMQPMFERVLPGQLFVDHVEGIARKPRSIYRLRLMAREVAISMWPDCKARLAKADGPDTDMQSDLYLGSDKTTDQVVLVESWHLPSGKGATDGRHVIAASNCDIVNEEYKRRRFPFAFYRWKNRRLGFWGSGIAEQCRDPQWRINKVIQKDERSQDLTANKWLLRDKRSGVSISRMNNEPLLVVDWDSAKGGSPPVIVENSTFSAETARSIQQIREETFSELGLSTQTAEGKKPAGLNSGAAQRAHDDIGSRRHLAATARYEQFFMDAVEILEDLNEELVEMDPGHSITGRTQRGAATLLNEVKWAEIRDPENKLRIRVFPTSFLPSTPSGKLAAVQEIVESGFVSKPFAQSLMDFPDLDAATRTELADLDFIQWQVEQILDGGAEAPDPHQDLVFARELARKSYLAARVNRAPEDVLEQLREFIQRIDKLTQATAAAAAPPQQAPGPQPPVGPEDVTGAGVVG